MCDASVLTYSGQQDPLNTQVDVETKKVNRQVISGHLWSQAR